MEPDYIRCERLVKDVFIKEESHCDGLKNVDKSTRRRRFYIVYAKIYL